MRRATSRVFTQQAGHPLGRRELGGGGQRRVGREPAVIVGEAPQAPDPGTGTRPA